MMTMGTTAPLTHDEFVRRLVAVQGLLRGFILTHVQEPGRAEDVLQDVSVILWKKLDTYDPQRSFSGWALGVARNEILHARRDTARFRIVFDEDLLDQAARRYEALEPELDRRRLALRHCVGKMPEHYRGIVEQRYGQALPIAEVARRLGKKTGAVHMLLSRIRQALADCASRYLAGAPAEVET
jgi:RNA polymerase sigma-70 factor (ECF subfamily)